MLFWIFVVVAVIGYVMYAIGSSRYDWDVIEFIGCLTAAIATVCVVISLIVIAYSYLTADAYVDSMHERYDSITYQYENDIYDNDNDLGKRELMVDIQSWNESLASRKELSENFWIGVYMPNIYNQFEFIELKGE